MLYIFSKLARASQLEVLTHFCFILMKERSGRDNLFILAIRGFSVVNRVKRLREFVATSELTALLGAFRTRSCPSCSTAFLRIVALI